MNLRTSNANDATGTFNRSKNVAPVQGSVPKVWPDAAPRKKKIDEAVLTRE